MAGDVARFQGAAGARLDQSSLSGRGSQALGNEKSTGLRSIAASITATSAGWTPFIRSRERRERE
jgi:hypothetical protein